MLFRSRLSCGWQQCKQAACKQKIKPAIGSGNGITRPQTAGDPKSILHRHIAQHPNVKIPQVFYVSEFGWIASVIFLYLLQYTLSSAGERRFSTGKALIAPLIGVPLCVFYCTFGDVLSNLLWCGMMIVVSYHSIRGLAYAQIQTGTACKMRYFHIGVLCYVAVEYVLWISGCLWPGYSISAPYCWLDLLLTGCLFALLPATGKAVQV